MLVPAAALGVDAAAPVEALRADAALLARIEALRLEAGRRMGLGDVAGSVVPKPCLIGPGIPGQATLVARYLTPHDVHRAMAVTGGITLAVAARTPGTLAHAMAAGGAEGMVAIAHPSGVMEVPLGMEGGVPRWAGVTRTARRIFEGSLLIPRAVWAGPGVAAIAAA
jgi:2-methylaconitate cis-trans-isomerase PrpF